jgi:hypothetical protein
VGLGTGKEDQPIYPGVFLLKLPSSGSRQASIAIEINPVDPAGSATKKRRIVIRSASELDQFNCILANQKLIELARRSSSLKKGRDRYYDTYYDRNSPVNQYL